MNSELKNNKLVLDFVNLVNSYINNIINDDTKYIYGLGTNNEIIGVNGAKNICIQHFINNAPSNAYIYISLMMMI